MNHGASAFCWRVGRKPLRWLTLWLWMITGTFGLALEPWRPVIEPIGSESLCILSPTILEISLVTTKAPDPARVARWDFVDDSMRLHAPESSSFTVLAGGQPVSVKAVGFRRRPLYAPLKKRDLRIGAYLYLELGRPISEGERVEVRNPDGRLWKTDQALTAQASALRYSPAIHVNQEGYLPEYPKQAMVGYYLGSLGELDLGTQTHFDLVEGDTTNVVFTGTLKLRPDRGFTFSPKPYQGVFEADFTAFKKPGQYRLRVPGLGASFPFWINEGIAADFTRAYALGLYHQRCGTSNALPFTRFVHDACHLPAASVPTMSYKAVNDNLAEMSGDFSANPRHTAPQLKNVNASLYPFVKTGKVEVSGGHHDAGDYSKYTINVAQLIHVLTFAADAFEGVGALDNLGLPESGDGKSDLLQEAKWEADFLAKLQDDDGGFYFLVYPRDRAYEDNVSLIRPDCGDPQVVFPKNTSATAATVAALAQISSSPLFKKQFPEASARYFEQAKKGWGFLQRAIAQHGRDGAYQKITHYGDEFMHEDELAWAATEMFLATGDRTYEKEVLAHFNPADPETRRWTWWRLFECYGNVIRSYAFAARTGRLQARELDGRFLEQCENEIISAAQDHTHWAADCAYGTSFPEPSKRFHTAGWYFSLDRAFDLATACELNYPSLNDPRPRFLEALISNMNYEGGCNPVNQVYLTGLGWNRQHELVNHFSQNQKRSLPPTGLAIGNIQEGFPWLAPYQKELGALTFPPDSDERNPYPFYDRWGDTLNTATEAVTVNLARGLGACAFLMARTPLKSQPWKGAAAQLQQVAPTSKQERTLRLESPGQDLGTARCLWETADGQVVIQTGSEPFTYRNRAGCWVETEAWWPDGRRVFAAGAF